MNFRNLRAEAAIVLKAVTMAVTLEAALFYLVVVF